jgi:hypothetical protein
VRAEVLSEHRNALGQLDVESIWLLSDFEVAQFKRAGLRKAATGTNRNVLAKVHHVFAPARVSDRGQRVITNASGALLHASGNFIAPSEVTTSPLLWQYDAAGRGLDTWTRKGGVLVPAFPYMPTDTRHTKPEYFDPQWQRVEFVRDWRSEVAEHVDWKGGLLEAQLAKGEPIVPVQRTSYAGQVGAGADDAHEADDGSGFDGTGITVNMIATGLSFLRVNGGARFTSVPFAQGATVAACTVEVWAFGSSSDDVNISMGFEDVDDAVDFVTNADVTTRIVSITAAQTAWQQDSLLDVAFVASPDFASSATEVFARAGWVANNDMVFLGDAPTTPDKTLSATSFETNSARAIKLNIDSNGALKGIPAIPSIPTIPAIRG